MLSRRRSWRRSLIRRSRRRSLCTILSEWLLLTSCFTPLLYNPLSELVADSVAFCQPESVASKHGLTAGSHDTKIILCVRHGGAGGAAEGKPAGHCWVDALSASIIAMFFVRAAFRSLAGFQSDPLRQLSDYLLSEPVHSPPPPLHRVRPLHHSALVPSELLQRSNVYRGLSDPKVVPGTIIVHARPARSA